MTISYVAFRAGSSKQGLEKKKKTRKNITEQIASVK